MLRHHIALIYRCDTLSNALEMSRYTERTSRGGLQSNALNSVYVVEINWLTVESPG